MISSYSFGKIVVEGKEFREDVVVSKSSVESWWRKQSHNVEPADVKAVVEKRPAIVVIGTGYSGVMRVSEETKRFIEGTGIKLVVEKTAEAVKTFNQTKEKDKVALLHLTC